MLEGNLFYIGVLLIIFIIFILFFWWYFGVYSVQFPGPYRPDGNFNYLINQYNSFKKSLWFQNERCRFDKYLTCKEERYIVFESNGDVIYDSMDNPKWARPKKYYVMDSPEQIRNSVEYIRAASLTQGIVIRGKVNNICEMAKDGDRYRLVHVSQYIYNRSDA